jgi:hypothetical protein|tara:strand:+ start:67 stop:366 length:300 start_codon:yes stop_codon:yes gene_type:complete
MTKLKINGLMNDEEIRWKKIKCCCSHIEGDVEHQFPIGKCMHCKCQCQEDSMPRDSFKINVGGSDKDGKPTGETIEKEVKEITIYRSKDGYDSILGWSF